MVGLLKVRMAAIAVLLAVLLPVGIGASAPVLSSVSDNSPQYATQNVTFSVGWSGPAQASFTVMRGYRTTDGDFEEGVDGFTTTGSPEIRTSGCNAGACPVGAKCLAATSCTETNTFTVTSLAFNITDPFLCYYIGGWGGASKGNDGYLSIDVNNDGVWDNTTYAPDADGWTRTCTNVSGFVGNTAKVKLVDADGGGSYAWNVFDGLCLAYANQTCEWYNLTLVVNTTNAFCTAPLAATNPASCNYAVQSSDSTNQQYWVQGCDGSGNCVNSTNYSFSRYAAVVPSVTSVSDDSTLSSPKAAGQDVTFSVNWSDPDNVNHTVYVFKAYNTTDGGFESTLDGFTATGTPAVSYCSGQTPPCPVGSTCLNSASCSEGAVFTVITEPFNITQPKLCVYIEGWGGGSRGNDGYLSVDWTNDGTYDSTTYAPDADSWARTCLDASAYVGNLSRVKMVDADGGSTYAHVHFDDLCLADSGNTCITKNLTNSKNTSRTYCAFNATSAANSGSCSYTLGASDASVLNYSVQVCDDGGACGNSSLAQILFYKALYPAGGNCTSAAVNPLCTESGACVINSSCWMFGQHSFTSLVINNSANITVTPYDRSGYNATGNYSTSALGWNGTGLLWLSVSGNVSIAANSFINATGAGYRAGNSTAAFNGGDGRGYGLGGDWVGSGGAYGGQGGRSWGSNYGGSTYGSFLDGAADMGSGGGYSPLGSAIDGRGGGAVRITAGSVVESNGSILADGAPGDPASRGGSGGSGGGITITGTTVSWYGFLNASGGFGITSGCTGALCAVGGGGRITVNASSGPVVFGRAYADGYWSNQSSGTIYSNGSTSGGGSCYLLNPGACVPGGACTITTNCTLFGSHVFTVFNVSSGAMVSLEPYDNSSYSVSTNQTLRSQGWSGRGSLSVNASAIYLYNGSVVNATGAGYLGRVAAPGQGRGYGSVNWGGGGGAYGSAGSAGYGGIPGGSTYGNQTHGGIDMGSAGGGSNLASSQGGSGGGSLWLNATGLFQSNGSLIANGAWSGGEGGAGSGGGITILASTLVLNGLLNASGASNQSTTRNSGPGGGGRISLWYDLNYSGVTANASAAWSGAGGTVFWNPRPLVNITVPLNSSYGASVTLNYTAANFNGTTVNCTYYLDGVGTNIGGLVANSSFNTTTLSGLSDGLHAVAVSCTNNTAMFAIETTRASSVVYFTADAAAPTYLANSTAYPATFGDAPGAVWLNVTWNDNVGVSVVRFEVDGVNYTPLSDPSDAAIRFLKWSSMAAGSHYWVAYANDSAGNFNATGNKTFAIATTPVGVSIYANNSASTDQRFNAPNITNITASFNASVLGTYELLYNGSASNETLNATGSPVIVILWSQLNATVLNFTARLNATQNYSGASASFRVPFPDVIAPQYSGVTSATPSVFNSNSVVWLNTTWTDNIGVTQVLVELDGVNYSATQDGIRYFLKLDGLGAGDHFWRSHALDAFNNYNVTANTSFTIARAPVGVSVYTNGSSSNSTYTLVPNLFNFTATKNVSEGTIELIFNYTGGDVSLASSSGAVASFLWNQSNNTGLLVTARYNQTQNYSAAGVSLQDTFATHAPNYTANASLTTGVYQAGFQNWFNATWVDDVAVGIVLFDIDGLNQTPLQDPSDASRYFVHLGALPAGLHWWQSYANDTAGMMNATGNQTFTILQAPVNASIYVNGSSANRSTEALVLNFTATKNVTEGTIELIYNGTGSTLSSTTGQQAYLVWLQNNLSSYLLTARFNATQNYSVSNSSLSLTINDATNPAVNNATVNESVAYRNNSLLFAANATDLWLNTVWFESNYSGSWANYSIAAGYNALYNYTIPGLSYTDHEIIGYRFWANDSTGRNASTSIAAFKISNLGTPNGSLLTSPSNSSVVVYNNATLNWTAAIDVDNDSVTYQVQFSNASDFNVASLNRSGVSTNGFNNLNQPGSAINLSTPVQAQYWRVRAFDGEEYGPWSDINNASVVFAVINFALPNNSIIRNATANAINATEVQGGDWINNVTLTVGSVGYQLAGDPSWTYAYTPGVALPQALRLTLKAYNQTMNDPAVFVSDAIDVRVARATGATAPPGVASLCGNASYVYNGSNVTISLRYTIDTLAEDAYLTLTPPTGSPMNLSPYLSAFDGLNLSRNYSFVANATGNFTLTAYLRDLENQTATGTSWFVSSTNLVTANFSFGGFGAVFETDACGNPRAPSDNWTYVRPPGNISVEVNVSTLQVQFNDLNISGNSSFGQALNYSDLLNSGNNISAPTGYRRVAQFEINSSLSNYSGALIAYNYSSVAGSLDNESSLTVFKCSNHANCTNETMQNVSFALFTNNKTVAINTTTFSIYTIAESSTSGTVVVTVTPTPAPTPTPVVTTTTVYVGGGGAAFREIPVEKKVEVIRGVDLLGPPMQLTTYSNDTLVAPIILTNNENVSFFNVTLSATSDSPEHVTLEFDQASFDEITPGGRRVSNLSIKTHSPLGVYNVTVTASVGSPRINQSTRLFVDLVERGGQVRITASESVKFARDLFRQNPECLDLSEFISRAEDALAQGDYAKASSYVQLSVDACRDLLQRSHKPISAAEVPAFVAASNPWQDYAVIGAFWLATILAMAFYFTRMRAPPKSKGRKLPVSDGTSLAAKRSRRYVPRRPH